MSTQVATSSFRPLRKPCPRCPHRLSDLWTHGHEPDSQPIDDHDKIEKSSSSSDTSSSKGMVEDEAPTNSQTPGNEAESTGTQLQTNNSSQTLIWNAVEKLQAKPDSKDKSTPQKSERYDEATEEYEIVWAISIIPGAPTPFNSPRPGTRKAPVRNMEDVVEYLKI